MLKKEIIVDSIEVLLSGHIQIRERTDIIEDGCVFSSTYHRRIINPHTELSDENDRVAAIAKAAWGIE